MRNVKTTATSTSLLEIVLHSKEGSRQTRPRTRIAAVNPVNLWWLEKTPRLPLSLHYTGTPGPLLGHLSGPPHRCHNQRPTPPLDVLAKPYCPAWPTRPFRRCCFLTHSLWGVQWLLTGTRTNGVFHLCNSGNGGVDRESER